MGWASSTWVGALFPWSSSPLHVQASPEPIPESTTVGSTSTRSPVVESLNSTRSIYIHIHIILYKHLLNKICDFNITEYSINTSSN